MSELIPEIVDVLPPRTSQEDLFRKRDLIFGLLYPAIGIAVLYIVVPLYVEAIGDAVERALSNDFRTVFVALLLIAVSLAPLLTAFGMARRAVRQALHRYRGVVASGVVSDFQKLADVSFREDDSSRNKHRIDWRLDVELADQPFRNSHVDVFRRTNEHFSPTIGDVIEVLVDLSGSSVSAYGDMRDYRESYAIGLIFFAGLCAVALMLAAIAAN